MNEGQGELRVPKALFLFPLISMENALALFVEFRILVKEIKNDCVGNSKRDC